MIVMKYCDYYACFKGACPYCKTKIYSEPEDYFIDDEAFFKCPVCGKKFRAKMTWE